MQHVTPAAGVKSGHFWKLLVKACGEALIEASLSLWSSFALTGAVQTWHSALTAPNKASWQRRSRWSRPVSVCLRRDTVYWVTVLWWETCAVDSCSSDAVENGSVGSLFVGTNELMSGVQRLYLYCSKASLWRYLRRGSECNMKADHWGCMFGFVCALVHMMTQVQRSSLLSHAQMSWTGFWNYCTWLCCLERCRDASNTCFLIFHWAFLHLDYLCHQLYMKIIFKNKNFIILLGVILILIFSAVIPKFTCTNLESIKAFIFFDKSYILALISYL